MACLICCRTVKRLLSLTIFTASFRLQLLNSTCCRLSRLWPLSRR